MSKGTHGNGLGGLGLFRALMGTNVLIGFLYKIKLKGKMADTQSKFPPLILHVSNFASLRFTSLARKLAKTVLNLFGPEIRFSLKRKLSEGINM